MDPKAPRLLPYPLIYDSATYRASDFVLISCANATSDGGRCNNGVDGGVFWGSASVTLALTPTADAEDKVMYTLDGSGSDPLSDSGKQFRSPIVLRETTQIRAVKIGGTQRVTQYRNVSYVKQA